MTVSVVIPTLNEERTIKATLNSLMNQDYDGDYEIIIVDGNSTDRTREIVSRYFGDRVRILSENDSNIAKARNIGVKNSRGEIIAFIDAGRIAPKNWLRKITGCLVEKDVAGIGGSFKFGKNLNLLEKFTALDKIYRTNLQKKYTDVVCTGNAIFRKEAIVEVGGFDERFARRGENSDFCYRISKKHRILCRPDIFVYYKDRYNLKKFLREHFLNGFYHFFLYLKHKKRIFRDDYRRTSLLLQPLVLTVELLLMLINFHFILFVIPAFLLLNLKFLHSIAEEGKELLIVSPFLQILRSLLWTLGAMFGFLYLIFERMK